MVFLNIRLVLYWILNLSLTHKCIVAKICTKLGRILVYANFKFLNFKKKFESFKKIFEFFFSNFENFQSKIFKIFLEGERK